MLSSSSYEHSPCPFAWFIRVGKVEGWILPDSADHSDVQHHAICSPIHGMRSCASRMDANAIYDYPNCHLAFLDRRTP
jgi:hypothetical protein